MGGSLLVAGDALLCSSQTRFLRSALLKRSFSQIPAAKNADTAAYLNAASRPQTQRKNKEPIK